MSNQRDIIADEKVTVAKMIRIYCYRKHNHKSYLCTDCENLLEYAWRRLDLCRHGQKKPTCGQCSIHCYKPEMRSQIQQVMRFAGPRMIIYHPLEALRHLRQSLRVRDR